MRAAHYGSNTETVGANKPSGGVKTGFSFVDFHYKNKKIPFYYLNVPGCWGWEMLALKLIS